MILVSVALKALVVWKGLKEKLVRKVPLDHRVLVVKKESRVNAVWMAQPEHEDHRENREQLVQLVPKVLVANRARKASAVLWVKLELKAQRVLAVQLELRESLEWRDLVALKDAKDHRDRKDLKVKRVRLDLVVKRAIAVNKVSRALEAGQEQLGNKAFQETEVHKVWSVLRDPRDFKAKRVRKGHKDSEDLKAFLVHVELMVRRVRREMLGPEANKGLEAKQVFRASAGSKALKVKWDRKESEVGEVKLVLWVIKAFKDHQESASQDLLVKLAKWDLEVQKVTEVMLAQKVQQGMLENLEQEVIEEKSVKKAKGVNQVLVENVDQEALANLEFGASGVNMVSAEKQACQDHREIKGQLDHEVAEASVVVAANKVLLEQMAGTCQWRWWNCETVSWLWRVWSSGMRKRCLADSATLRNPWSQSRPRCSVRCHTPHN